MTSSFKVTDTLKLKQKLLHKNFSYGKTRRRNRKRELKKGIFIFFLKKSGKRNRIFIFYILTK